MATLPDTATAVATHSHEWNAQHFLEVRAKAFESRARELYQKNKPVIAQKINENIFLQHPTQVIEFHLVHIDILTKVAALFQRYMGEQSNVQFIVCNEIRGHLLSDISLKLKAQRIVCFVNALNFSIDPISESDLAQMMDMRLSERAEDCSLLIAGQWRFNVAHIPIRSLRKIVDVFKKKGFNVALENPFGVVSLDHPTGCIRQELTIQLPCLMLDSSKASPSYLLERRKQAEQRPHTKSTWTALSLDQKMKEVIQALQQVAAQDTEISCWKLNIYDVTLEDAYTIQARLNLLGFQAAINLHPYDYYESSGQGFQHGKWVRSRDLTVYAPHRRRSVSPVHLMFQPLLQGVSLDIFCDHLQSLPLTQFLTADQRCKLYFQWCKHQGVETWMKQSTTRDGIELLARNTKDHEANLYHAFAAALNCQISDNQFASFALLYSAIEQIIKWPKLYRKTVVNSTDAHAPFPMYWEEPLPPANFILPTAHHLLDDSPDFISSVLDESLGLTQKGQEHLFMYMKSAPFSEQFFYLIPLPVDALESWSPLFARLNQVYSPFFYPFEQVFASSPAKLSQKMLMIPSFTMISALLSIQYGSDAIALRPILGDLTKEQIEGLKEEDTRLVQVSMPGIHPPSQADGHFTGGPWAFTMHDAYHAQRDSSVQLKDRLALRRINRLVKNTMNEPSVDAGLENLQWRLNDGELHFSSDACPTPEPFGALFHLPFWPDSAIQLVIQDMARYPEIWGRSFGITAADLLSPEREMYEKLAADL